MAEISSAQWDQMVGDYEAAVATAHAAQRAYDAATDATRAERRRDWEELQRLRHERQEALLSVEAPTIEAAAYQLRIFAEICRLPDPAGPLPSGEDHVGVLHRIYSGLRKLAAAHATS